MDKSTNTIPQQFFEEALVKQLAKHEEFWRNYALESAQAALIKEHSKTSAPEVAEEILSFVKDGTWPKLDDCIPEGSILEAIDQYFREFTDIPRELPFYSVLHYLSMGCCRFEGHLVKV